MDIKDIKNTQMVEKHNNSINLILHTKTNINDNFGMVKSPYNKKKFICHL